MEDPKAPFDAVAYKNQYTKDKYDRVSLVLLGKGKKKELIEHIKKYHGKMSLNEWINLAIGEKLEREIADLEECQDDTGTV